MDSSSIGRLYSKYKMKTVLCISQCTYIREDSTIWKWHILKTIPEGTQDSQQKPLSFCMTLTNNLICADNSFYTLHIQCSHHTVALLANIKRWIIPAEFGSV